jgi:Fic family protein
MADREILQELVLFKEASYSWLIDNTNSDFSCLLSARGCGKDISMIQYIMLACESLFTQTIDVNALEHIYGTVKHGGNSEGKMHFRKTPAFPTNAVSNLRQYSPTAPEHIWSALNDLMGYLKQDTSNALIKAAMAYYQFEMIRPFDNYNGIMGRLLVMHTLIGANFHAMKYLCPSELLYNAKNEYSELLYSTQKSGGYIRWIKFFVKIILAKAQQNCDMIKKYQHIVSRDEAKLREHPVTKSALLVWEHWKRNIISTITQAASELGLAYNTVERSVQLFQSLGMLSQLPSEQRTRRFTYSELMSLLSDDFIHYGRL